MIPIKCHLWKKEKLIENDLTESLVFLKKLPSIENVSESVMVCVDCRQLYIVEFNDFFASQIDDYPVYLTYVPVSEAELVEHAKVKKTLGSIQEYSPKLLFDIKKEGTRIRWIGKR